MVSGFFFLYPWIKTGHSTIFDSLKREIGHLCHDEQKPKVQDKPLETATAVAPAPSYTPGILVFFFFSDSGLILLFADIQ